jgi:hypothetical protein
MTIHWFSSGQAFPVSPRLSTFGNETMKNQKCKRKKKKQKTKKKKEKTKKKHECSNSSFFLKEN